MTAMGQQPSVASLTPDRQFAAAAGRKALMLRIVSWILNGSQFV